jgi:small subunit ribosomal protein S6
MVHYEVNFIIDPVLSGDEIKSTAKIYESLLKDQGCEITNVHEIGLKQLAYPINKRTSGVYYCIEFTTPTGAVVAKLELALRRDERIIRFLTVKLDKYGVKYNDDRRSGKITSYKKREKKKAVDGVVEQEAVAPEPIAPKVVAATPVHVEEVPVVEAPVILESIKEEE